MLNNPVFSTLAFARWIALNAHIHIYKMAYNAVLFQPADPIAIIK